MVKALGGEKLPLKLHTINAHQSRLKAREM
jgi:hypothetical protein